MGTGSPTRRLYTYQGRFHPHGCHGRDRRRRTVDDAALSRRTTGIRAEANGHILLALCWRPRQPPPTEGPPTWLLPLFPRRLAPRPTCASAPTAPAAPTTC